MSEDPKIHADTFDLMVRKEVTVRGSSMSYSAPFPGYEWPTALRFIRNGRIRLDPLITHSIPLEDGSEAFDMMASSRQFYVKVLLLP
jgi:threonine dehydrogenase-like Zn-dependent dehydrogenase